jgi:lysophospholipase L1-like esterase
VHPFVAMTLGAQPTLYYVKVANIDGSLAAVQPGDYVIIQFGHNDEVEHKIDRYTTPDEYQHNLQLFIDSTLAKHATPILMTPIIRRYFDKQGQLVASHPYAQWVRRVASNNPDIAFIDMEIITGRHFLALGDTASATRFMHIQPDMHPNYPNGIRDDTHLNQLGAREVAQLVLQQLKATKHELASRTRKPDPKHLSYRYSDQ